MSQEGGIGFGSKTLTRGFAATLYRNGTGSSSYDDAGSKQQSDSCFLASGISQLQSVLDHLCHSVIFQGHLCHTAVLGSLARQVCQARELL